MKSKWTILAVIFFLFGFILIATSSARSSNLYGEILPTPEELLESALWEAVTRRSTQSVMASAYDLRIEYLQVSSDGNWASAWLVYTDPDSGLALPTEPGVTLARWDGQAWQVYLPGEVGWIEAIQASPIELIPQQEKSFWVDQSQTSSTDINPDALTGYLLPWQAGQTANLSRSVSHDEDYPTGNAHYSFDFYVPGETICPSGGAGVAGTTGYNFSLYAAKSGTVWSYKDTVEDCDHSDVNFLVIRDADDPAVYHLYLHLSQNSIPPSLKQIGAQVIQGQFVGIVDNTGVSTGSHLHFQVEQQPYWPPENPYWAKSLDISFAEVNIYGGRPRREFEKDPEFCEGPDDDYLCNEDGRLTYLSANIPKGDFTPPIGDLNGVLTGEIIQRQMIDITGWGWDADSGMHHGQIMAAVGADKNWHPIGEVFTSTINYTWDLCESSYPIADGAVSVALRLTDNDGNWNPVAGLRHFMKDFECPTAPPACNPAAEQVALFEEVDYSGGCVIYEVGNYPDDASLGALGGDDASSIRVGSNVVATLYSAANYLGHAETLAANDSYLLDNRIGNENLSSMRIVLREDLPQVPIPASPIPGSIFNAGDVVLLAWMDGGGAIEFEAQVIPAGSPPVSTGWQRASYAVFESLSAGSYTWQVRGRNGSGVVGSWSNPQSFLVDTAPAIPTPVSAPYSTDFEDPDTPTIWSHSGYWTWLENENLAQSDPHAWWYRAGETYDDGQVNSGNLTSPPISLPTTGTYYLRFWYRTETETYTPFWDQRWVQISVDGGPFHNLYQFSEDPMMFERQAWLQSPALSLQYYSGHIIQVRFHFNTLDAYNNQKPGWGIDDFSISATPPATCSDNRMDDTPAQATPLVIDPDLTTEGEICPGGDVDYYVFTGQAGDLIVADIDAYNIGSSLDGYLILYDSSGSAILAEHDDEIYAEIRDPLLVYTLPESGIYYIKVRAWDHPSGGGANYDYEIRLLSDAGRPSATLLAPSGWSYLPVDPFNIEVQVIDETMINHVDFYWHASDWAYAPYIKLGSDRDSTNGWKQLFDPSILDEQIGVAILVEAYDKAGHLAATAAWEVGVDKTPPSSEILSLESPPDSTAFMLSWTGVDSGSGIDHYNLQLQANGGSWQDYSGDLIDQSSWVVAAPSYEYGYRLRAVDSVGNTEDYPATAEITVTLPTADVLCAQFDSYDSGGNDNTPANATLLPENSVRQLHNFCNPTSVDRLNDIDWMRFTVQSGHRYLIIGAPLVEASAPVLSLYATDGVTLLAESVPDTFGQFHTLSWTASTDGTVYLRVRHLNGGVIGTTVAYQVWVIKDYAQFLPDTRR